MLINGQAPATAGAAEELKERKIAEGAKKKKKKMRAFIWQTKNNQTQSRGTPFTEIEGNLKKKADRVTYQTLGCKDTTVTPLLRFIPTIPGRLDPRAPLNPTIL